MTTIVVDRKTLSMAADRQMTHSDGHMVECASKVKKLTSKDGRRVLMGSCGDAIWAAQFEDEFAKLFVNGESGKRNWKGSDFNTLVLYEDHDLVFYNNSGIPLLIKSPYFGIGSGANFALGALHHGSSLKEAINIASRCDANTGFGIQVECLDAPKRRKKSK